MKRTNIPKRKITRSSSFPLSFFESFYQKHNRCNFTLSLSLARSFRSVLFSQVTYMFAYAVKEQRRKNKYAHTHIFDYILLDGTRF